MQYSKAVEPINCFNSHSIYTIVLPLQCCTISCYCCCLTVQYSKAVEHIPFMVSHVFTSVYCLCMYIASLFVISMEGMVLFLWLSGVVIREYTECLFTHRHLSVVCSVFTVGILLNIYSVTDCTHYIMSVSGQCTVVFQ